MEKPIQFEVVAKSADIFHKPKPSFFKSRLIVVFAVVPTGNPPPRRGSFFTPRRRSTELPFQESHLTTHSVAVTVFRRRALAADKCIGSFCIPMKDLFQNWYWPESENQHLASGFRNGACAIWSEPEKIAGVVYFLYRFGGDDRVGEKMKTPLPSPASSVYPSAPPLEGEDERLALMNEVYAAMW